MGVPALSGRWAIPGPDQVCPPLTPRPAASCLRRSPTSQTSLSGGGGGPGRSALPARTKGTGRPAPPAEATFLAFGKKSPPVPAQGTGAQGPRPRPGFRPPPRPTVKRSPAGTRGPRRQAQEGSHSPDLGTCGGIVLAMRVHRTTCSGHRPPSSPRPMAAPAAPHRPARARTPRLRALRPRAGRPAAVRPDVAPRAAGRVAAGEARGAPAAEGSGAGGRPGRARGVSSGPACE